MRFIAYPVLGLLAFSVYANSDDVPIHDSFELQEWCKSETEAYYIAHGITPYNWTADWWEEGNILHVKGGWRVGRDDVIVECRVAKGAKRKYATYQIPDGAKP